MDFNIITKMSENHLKPDPKLSFSIMLKKIFSFEEKIKQYSQLYLVTVFFKN